MAELVKPPKYRLPEAAPSQADIDDRTRWDALVAASETSTRASAEKWRAGLAAFVTLITGGLLVKGPEAATAIEQGWRALLTALFGVGLAAAVTGLWFALEAAAGSAAKVNYEAVRRDYGGVRQFQVAMADASVKSLDRAKWAVGIALVLLGAAVFVWWWAPTSGSPAFIQIQIEDSKVCGELLSADNSVYRVEVSGTSNPISIDFDDVINVSLTDSC